MRALIWAVGGFGIGLILGSSIGWNLAVGAARRVLNRLIYEEHATPQQVYDAINKGSSAVIQ